MRILIAPDSFKGTATAVQVAEAIAAGWRSVRDADDVTLIPLADGGEGTLDALHAAVPGATLHTVPQVTGPDGAPRASAWLELPGRIAVVELATSSGLPLMTELDPLGATTRGLGETIAAAVADGAEQVWVGLGGSASTDGGLGALRALGARALGEDGEELPDGGGALELLATLDLSGLVPIPGGMTLLTDVTSPLLGADGAAAVFGPQKGATTAQVEQLDRALERFAAAMARHSGLDATTPGAGAAGGAGYGLAAAYDARIDPGADRILEMTHLADHVRGADLVITGEGAFDHQSLRGKLVGTVLELAAAQGSRSAVVAGVVRHDPGVTAVSLTDLAGPVEAMANPVTYLQHAGAQLARTASVGSAGEVSDT